MADRKMKRVEDSMAEQSFLLMPRCLNAAGYLLADNCLHGLTRLRGL